MISIISHNVNGVRARLKNNYEQEVLKYNPDILCLQEFRAKTAQVPQNLFEDYIGYHSIHEKAGYAGSSVYVKKTLTQPTLFLDDIPDNNETGRVAILDFRYFKLIASYTPNAGQNLEKLEHRLEWQEKLRRYIAIQPKPVIFCGDLNCAHKPIDTACPSVKSGCSTGERTAHQYILNTGMIDIWREQNPDKQEYTWFSNTHAARAANRGMRIDYFLISKELKEYVQEVKHIYDEALTAKSDHQPIQIIIDIKE